MNAEWRLQSTVIIPCADVRAEGFLDPTCAILKDEFWIVVSPLKEMEYNIHNQSSLNFFKWKISRTTCILLHSVDIRDISKSANGVGRTARVKAACEQSIACVYEDTKWRPLLSWFFFLDDKWKKQKIFCL